MNITFQGLVNLYRHLRVEQRDIQTANLLKDCLGEISLLSKKTKDDFPPQFLKVVNRIKELSAAIKTKEIEYSPIESRDPEIRGFESQGDLIWQLMKELNKGQLVQIVQKTVDIALTHFPEVEKVEQILLLEAAKQDSMIRLQQGFEIRIRQESQKLCSGLIGFYEIIMKRPALQYTKVGPILLTFPAHLHKVIKSFSNPKEVDEAIVKLEYLVQQTRTHKEILLTLCHESPQTESLIHRLSALNTKAELNDFYQSLKNAMLSESQNTSDLLGFIEAEAEKISSSIPINLKGDMVEIARGLANGFMKHGNHGSGARLSGSQTIVTNYSSDIFGDGLTDSGSSVPINISNPQARGQITNQKTKQALKKISEDIFNDFYHKKELHRYHYTVGAHIETLIEERNADPLSRALGTIATVVEYHLVQENTNLFGIDRTREPEIRKKVIIFGITNNIFPQEVLPQILLYLRLSFDREVLAAIAATRAQFATQEEQKGD